MVVDKQTLLILGTTATLAAGSAVWYWRAMRFNSARLVRRAIRDISHEVLRDIVLPDGLGGTVHIDYLLLTSRGLLVLDVKDVHGTVFAGDNMDEWTVMQSGGRRHAFRNPQNAAMRRVSAVREVVRDVPVHSRIALTPNGSFTGTLPTNTTTLDALRREFDKSGDAAGQRQVDAFYRAWTDLRRISRPEAAGQPVAA